MSRNLTQSIIFFSISLLLFGCATPSHRDLDQLRPGMDKDEVLGAVGDPKRTFRSGGQDHWIYIFFDAQGAELSRQLDFADGKLVRIGRTANKQSLEQQLENAETLEEFEAKARAQQRKNSSGFKDVDGGSKRANGN